MKAEEILDNTFREDCGYPFFGLIVNTSKEGLIVDADNIKHSILAAMKRVARLAFDAGYNRNDHEQTIFKDGFNSLLSEKANPDKEQFINDLFNTSK